MSSKTLRGSLMLLLAAFIWGCAFVFQEEAADSVGAFTMNGLRSVIAGFVLLPLVFFFNGKRRTEEGKGTRVFTKSSIFGGIMCGVALAVAANLQQFGIMFNASLAEGDSGKAGFITAMYIIFVPAITCIIGRGIKTSVVISVLLGALGLYFISVKDGFSVATGDIVLLLCALAFSLHILTVDHFVKTIDAVTLSCVQFFTTGVISLVLMLIFESEILRVGGILSAAVPILYLGVMSSGVAYTLQVVGQKYSEPTVASLLMSLESLFAMVAACVYYKSLPTIKEAIGCVLMLVAIFLIQTPFVDRLFIKFKVKFKTQTKKQ